MERFLNFLILGLDLLELLWQHDKLLLQLSIPVEQWANFWLIILLNRCKLSRQFVLLVIKHVIQSFEKGLVLFPNLIDGGLNLGIFLLFRFELILQSF